MITRDDFHIGEKDRELLPIETDSMPYVCKYADRRYFLGGRIPWHWHQAFEIDYVLEGEITFYTMDEQIRLCPGEMVFINTNVIHRAEVSDDIKLYAHLFDMHYLSGVHGSGIEARYFSPIANSRALRMYHVKPQNLRAVRMAECVIEAADAAEKEEFGFELEIRALLGRFWQLLLLETESLRKNDTKRNGREEERVKPMLDFIHTHYPDDITLSMVAESAGVSERECTRVFRKNTGFTPIDYLRRYRIRRAEQLLLNSDESISVISSECGFRNLSYFDKNFLLQTGKTPSEYRRDGRTELRTELTSAGETAQ